MEESKKRGGMIQGFAPKQIVTITADATWTPEENWEAFRVPVSCNYYNSITGSGHETALIAGSITVLHRSIVSYVFDTTMELEVMS